MSESITKDMLNGVLKSKYINLTTYRANGEGVPTPVMFAEVNNRLYVETRASRYKVKRIINNPDVQFSACTMRGKVNGSIIKGKARILGSSEQDIAYKALRKRYFRFRLGDFLSKLSSSNDKKKIDERVYLEIVPDT
ncbi:MAG: PPOX class F420-dependent oxidoreductase [Promethearchaeota archaeon]